MRQLRIKAKAALATLTAEPEARGGSFSVRTVLYPLGGEDRPPVASQCPVCQAIAASGRQWLEAAAENVRLEQPGWITLPTCTGHLLQCLALPDPALRRAALNRYLEVALPGRTTPAPAPADGEAPKRRRLAGRDGSIRRRKKARWLPGRRYENHAPAATHRRLPADGPLPLSFARQPALETTMPLRP